MTKPTEPEPPTDQPAAGPDDPTEDAARRKFREALRRKAGGRGAPNAPHDPGRSVVPPGNSKRQRNFRRKSG